MSSRINRSRKNLSVAHVVSDIHRPDSGLDRAVVRLTDELARSAEVQLHTLAPGSSATLNARATYYQRSQWFGDLGLSRPMSRGLPGLVESSQVVHAHGLWTMPTIYAGRSASAAGVPLMLSPHGMMEPWTLDWHRYRKRLFSAVIQRRIVKMVHTFHATSEMEADSIRAAGVEQPIAIIPLGIDIPTDHTARPGSHRVALYMGRLHPKKNVDGLLRSWGSIVGRNPDWRLVIAGPGDPRYVSYLRSIARADDRVEFPGPVFGSDKEALLNSAELFVLPSHSENFGIVVTEALSHGTPVIVTKGTPWQSVEARGCGWWVDSSDQSLAAAVDAALNLGPDTLQLMGSSGRAWVSSTYSWPSVAKKTLATYSWMVGDSARPPWVRS